MAWKGIVAKSFTPDQFDAYVNSLTWTTWKPQFIVLHNTAVPSLSQRPDGFSLNNIRALEAYYRDQQGWSAGPHLFVDDKQIWVFTPLTVTGVHSPSWNSVAFGIEMLGDFARESFTDGRGLRVRYHATRAMAALSKKHGFPPDSWHFHVEDKRSDHDCPGKLARACRADLVKEIAAHMAGKTPPVIDTGRQGPWSKIADDKK